MPSNNSGSNSGLQSTSLPSPRERFYIAFAALLALFLAALDTLVMSAAMPTVVADLGALHLYSWVFTAYMLSRALTLPILGKLSDIFKCKNLFIISIVIFMAGSLFAGISQNMLQLVIARAVQGIGGGGNYALCYVVLSEITEPRNRSKMISWVSVIWGIASIMGPPLGGFIVSYFSWRWVFFINLPLGIISLLGIYRYLQETRVKTKEIVIDYAGIATMSVTVLSLLAAFMVADQAFTWLSVSVISLLLLSAASGIIFCFIEKHAREPLLSISYFRVRGFWTSNVAVFWCSFAIFSILAFSPLFIQGALGKTPKHLSVALLTLSLAWSLGAWICGRTVGRFGKKRIAVFGALFLVSGSGISLTFTSFTSLFTFSMAMALVGLGMGFVSLATLLVAQESLDSSELGMATSTHQFLRSMGGTIGVGISGSLVTSRLSRFLERVLASGKYESLDQDLITHIKQNIENLFQPEFQSQIPSEILQPLQNAVCAGVTTAFWACVFVSLICLLVALVLPAGKRI